jgi:muramoyltetrapeptide carboxypeptidase
MNRPSYLKKNDKVAVVAPASFIEKDVLMAAIRCMENWGLKVIPGEHVFAQHHQFAGTDAQRAADLQAAVNDPEIKAIICARGGYGGGKIIDTVDFSPLTEYPKWLVGFSDITLFHARLNRLDLLTIHGTMPINFPADGTDNESTNSLKDALFGKLKSYKTPPHELNKKGAAKAMLVGGNLSLIAHLSGTKDTLNTIGRILFIEEVGEYLYNIDRLMTQLYRNGTLASISGFRKINFGKFVPSSFM